jgi:hypothetical protein
MTTFSFAMNFRDLAKFIISLRREPFAMFHEVADELLAAIWRKDYALKEWLEEAVKENWYKSGPLNPRPTNTVSAAVAGDFAVIQSPISLGLRSQLIRHRALQVKDHLSDFFNADRITASMETTMPVQILMPIDFAEDLVRKRSCWIAQTDLWEPIVTKLMGLLMKDKVMLPCDDGKCRFVRDNDLRKEGHDPSPPCPILAKIDGEKMKQTHLAEAKIYAARRPHTSFWNKVLENA